ncbi:MAG TPA: NIPSNAP family protein [Thermoanaerobaculia bacterium]|nr:NIPSNAP family protein [Thermoanaerobaculia bacterium]
MVVVRNVFRLKFGKAREAQEAVKNILAVSRRIGLAEPGRVMTDVTGPFYTLVHELTFPELADLERMQQNMSDPAWKDAYAKFVPLVESGYREIFRVVE